MYLVIKPPNFVSDDYGPLPGPCPELKSTLARAERVRLDAFNEQWPDPALEDEKLQLGCQKRYQNKGRAQKSD